MDLDSYERKKRALARSRPVDLQFLSIKELPHFVGYKFDTNAVIPVNADYENPAFLCEVNLYQPDPETGIAFRYISARLSANGIVEFETEGVPQSYHEYYKSRVMAIYRLVYPYGLSLEDMELRV